MKRKDKHNDARRTKHVMLEISDAMKQAMDTGYPYRTRLDPPPADPLVAHPPRTQTSKGRGAATTNKSA